MDPAARVMRGPPDLPAADPGSPDVLVLDETTALLDPGAARDLERSRAAVLHGRTVVAIAHRLSTAFDADLSASWQDTRD